MLQLDVGVEALKAKDKPNLYEATGLRRIISSYIAFNICEALLI